MNAMDEFFDAQDESVKACLLALRAIILNSDKDVTVAWKYGMPFFCYKGRMFCYVWVDKKSRHPYLGIVEGKHIQHPKLIQEKRSRMKIMLFDPGKDLPITVIRKLLKQTLDLYRKGIVAVRS
ncbi:MAG TPA: DUF1801 domain-containing protein [Flavitalea sp.]|nr:DUF1801 domain-containing protein [Flavitalea sp.]